MLLKETLKKVLLDLVDRLDKGNSDYSDFELEQILDTINRVTNTEKKFSKEQACRLLGISRATFDNYVRAGKIPKGRKELGFKELFWTKGQLNEFIYEANN